MQKFFFGRRLAAKSFAANRLRAFLAYARYAFLCISVHNGPMPRSTSGARGYPSVRTSCHTERTDAIVALICNTCIVCRFRCQSKILWKLALGGWPRVVEVLCDASCGPRLRGWPIRHKGNHEIHESHEKKWQVRSAALHPLYLLRRCDGRTGSSCPAA